VAVLHTPEGYLLVHKPGRAEDEWLFPGGGLEEGDDIILADTAGRSHSDRNLMDEELVWPLKTSGT